MRTRQIMRPGDGRKNPLFFLLGALLVLTLFGFREFILRSMSSKLSDEDLEKIVQSTIARINGKKSNWVQNEEIQNKVENSVKLAVSKQFEHQKLLGKPMQSFPLIKERSDLTRKRILVTGGAGFVGSHLVDKLMTEGHVVSVVDNLFTGQRRNIEQWIGHPNFEFVIHDVINPFLREVDEIYHLACPASPPHYQYNAIKTIKTNAVGTLNMLGLAKRVQAKILLASTSEIYGDPLVDPQNESYWGNVNTMGPRSCYDEGKRVAESMMYAYHVQEDVQIRIARIFNTFGPRMNLRDGRVVSNFVLEALQNKPITLYGNGKQTRSFQYIDDLVEGLVALMESNTSLPVNIGNPKVFSIREIAEVIISLTKSSSRFENLPATIDDPQRRRPDITRAKEIMGWVPRSDVIEGLKKTIAYFETELEGNDVEPMKPPK